MQLYAITNRKLFARHEELIEQAISLAGSNMDYIQIREKDLAEEDLCALAAGIVSSVRAIGSRTRVLLNGPAEWAAKTGCDGVHLPANLPDSALQSAIEVISGAVSDPVISVSCHTLSDIEHARDHGATLALFAPVFEKQSGAEVISGQGIDALAAACRTAGPMPVFALGGVTAVNAHDCICAGAAGVAAIRLFASDDWRNLRLRV